MNGQPRRVITTGRLVEHKNGFIKAHSIPVRSDVALPFPGDQVNVVNEDTGQVFDGEVTHVDWAHNTYDITARVE